MTPLTTPPAPRGAQHDDPAGLADPSGPSGPDGAAGPASLDDEAGLAGPNSPGDAVGRNPAASPAGVEVSPGDDTETRCLRFVRPMPGLDGLLRYRIDPLDPVAGDATLFTLTSLDSPSITLLVAVPWVFFPDYAPEVDPDDAAALDLTEAEDALLFVVLTTAATAADTTANLLAPIVVHRHSLRAVQVLLTGSELPLRARLGA